MGHFLATVFAFAMVSLICLILMALLFRLLQHVWRSAWTTRPGRHRFDSRSDLTS